MAMKSTNLGALYLGVSQQTAVCLSLLVCVFFFLNKESTSFFFVTVSCNTGQPQIHTAEEDNLELLVLLPPLLSPRISATTHGFMWCQGSEPRALSVLCKHTPN